MKIGLVSYRSENKNIPFNLMQIERALKEAQKGFKKGTYQAKKAMKAAAIKISPVARARISPVVL